MTSRLSELRAKMRAHKAAIGYVHTDAECDAMLRELCKTVRDATLRHERKYAPVEWEFANEYIPGIDDDGATVAEVIDCDYWDADDGAELLTHTDQHDAIEYALDSVDPSDWPDELTLYGYNRKKPDPGIINRVKGEVVERFMEHMLHMEELGDPEGSDTPPEITEAARVFAETAVKHYDVWACEKVTSETINVARYVKEEISDWMEEESVREWVEPRLRALEQKGGSDGK